MLSMMGAGVFCAGVGLDDQKLTGGSSSSGQFSSLSREMQRIITDLTLENLRLKQELTAAVKSEASRLDRIIRLKKELGEKLDQTKRELARVSEERNQIAQERDSFMRKNKKLKRKNEAFNNENKALVNHIQSLEDQLEYLENQANPRLRLAEQAAIVALASQRSLPETSDLREALAEVKSENYYEIKYIFEDFLESTEESRRGNGIAFFFENQNGQKFIINQLKNDEVTLSKFGIDISKYKEVDELNFDVSKLTKFANQIIMEKYVSNNGYNHHYADIKLDKDMFRVFCLKKDQDKFCFTIYFIDGSHLLDLTELQPQA